jgi:hypothetical protein
LAPDVHGEPLRDNAMGQRPPHVKPPEYLSENPPVPVPKPAEAREGDPLGNDPTRYGDWELKGIAVDF